MKWARLKRLYGWGFRSLEKPFSVDLPESGLVLVKGFNKDTGDSSASGKSSLVLAIGHLFGGCKYPSTTLQSWYSEEPALVGAIVATPEGDWTVERCKGLKIVSPEGTVIKGKAAEAELDKLFGMDSWLRSLSTYRGQKQDGLFLSMTDQEKKEFFTKALRLDRYEKVASDAAEAATKLKDRLMVAEGLVQSAEATYHYAQKSLQELPEVEAVPEDGLDELNETLAVAEERRDAAIQAADLEVNHILRTAEGLVKELLAGFNKTAFTVENPELVEARAEITKVNERLDKVRQHDSKRRQELEQTKSGLKMSLYKAQTEADKAPALLQRLEKLRHQEQHLLGHHCPTCEQLWVTPSAQNELETVKASIVDIEAQIQKTAASKKEVAARTAELSGFPAFVPHPFEEKLKQRSAELTKFIAEAGKEEIKAAAAATAKVQAEEKKIRDAAQLRASTVKQSYMSVASSMSQEVTSINQTIRATTARIQAAKSAAAAKATAEKNYAKAKSDFEAALQKRTETQTAVYSELDLNAMVGRSGFLGVIFDDVLAEAAAATNEVSSRVANVRHVTFSFDSEKESKSGSVQRRITPVVTIDGKSVDFEAGLSGGMQSAIKLAVDLGVGEVVAKRRGSYPGWLVLDESFDGLGRASKESCLEMLQAYAGDRLVLVIDHSSEFQGLFQQVITVTSSNGRSTIS